MGQQQDGNPVDKANMPSYLPARTFAAGHRWTSWSRTRPVPTKIDEVIPQIERLPEPARSSILALAKGANQDVARFRLNIERWYDDQMDRVAGWYKRHVRVFIIVFAAIFAVAFNVNVVTLAQSLYTNPDARKALVVQGDALQSCPADQRDACNQAAIDTVVKLGKTSLPLFWQPTNIACLERARDAQAGNELRLLRSPRHGRLVGHRARGRSAGSSRPAPSPWVGRSGSTCSGSWPRSAARRQAAQGAGRVGRLPPSAGHPAADRSGRPARTAARGVREGVAVAEHDLVIRGGTVVDGTGAPARTADVAIDGGRITEVGAVDGRGRREIDADGLARHARLRRHPHPLRRPGHLGQPPAAVGVARRDHRRDGQLRRRLRAGAARPTTTASSS